MADVLTAAAGSPLLLTCLVLFGALVWAIEKLGGVDGPATRALRAWQQREVRRLHRQRLADAERRAGRDARVAELESEVAWLREQLDEARADARLPSPREADTSPMRRNSARPVPPPR